MKLITIISLLLILLLWLPSIALAGNSGFFTIQGKVYSMSKKTVTLQQRKDVFVKVPRSSILKNGKTEDLRDGKLVTAHVSIKEYSRLNQTKSKRKRK